MKKTAAMADAPADEMAEPVMRRPATPPIHGRGASGNPANRFEALALEPDPEDLADEERPAPNDEILPRFHPHDHRA